MSTVTELELNRRDGDGALQPWALVADADSATGLADPVIDAGVRTKLGEILTELAQKLEAGQAIALDAATLAALEQVTATIANLPADYPLPAAQVTDLKSVQVTNQPADYPLPSAQVTDLKTVTVANQPTQPLTDSQLRATAVPIDLGRELTERLLAKAPADGYRLWFDTANTSHLYILEAPAGTAASAVGFRGIRITLDASGNPVGAVQTNTSATLTFDNRTTDPGWAA